MAQSPLLRLPVELRLKIYQFILISNLSFDCRILLWRSVGVDNFILRIGYFRRDSIMPLLLANHQIHTEAASVLYDENTFVFHISGFSNDPLAFFESLPMKYVCMLRKVYVRTGHCILGPADWHTQNNLQTLDKDPATVGESRRLLRRDIAVSTVLMKRAWPKHFDVHINSQSVVSRSGLYGFEDVKTLWRSDCRVTNSSSAWHFWKMTDLNPGSEVPRMEFRRIVWDTPSILHRSNDIATI